MRWKPSSKLTIFQQCPQQQNRPGLRLFHGAHRREDIHPFSSLTLFQHSSVSPRGREAGQAGLTTKPCDPRHKQASLSKPDPSDSRRCSKGLSKVSPLGSPAPRRLKTRRANKAQNGSKWGGGGGGGKGRLLVPGERRGRWSFSATNAQSFLLLYCMPLRRARQLAPRVPPHPPPFVLANWSSQGGGGAPNT